MKQRSGVRNFAWTLAFLMMMAAAVSAQMGTSSVFGSIADPQGAAVTGATVSLTDARGNTRTMQSDASGTYSFTALQPGLYQLKVEAKGFRTTTVPALELLVDTRSRSDVGLQVGAATETVEVVATREVLNTADGSLGNVITPAQVRSLPLEALNPVGLLTLQPGVSYTGDPTDSRSGAVGGARSDQNNVTLDGTDINDTQTQAALTSLAVPVPLESIQELRFTTANANTDLGRTGGGQVSFVTKSGTNAFHGALFEAHRNTATTANDWFKKRQQVLASSPNKPPKLLRNVFGGSIGGPVLRDRAFFFLTYEGTRTRSAVNALRVVPSDTLRAGTLVYKCSGATCPSSGVFTLSSAQLKQVDPASIGVSPAMLGILSGFPHCNDLNQGLDNGLNFCGFRFSAPINTDRNIYVARLDYNLSHDGRHSLSWRGSLGNTDQDSVEQLYPGQPAQQKLLDNSKGFAATYSAQIRPTFVNVFRYGFTRQGLDFSGEHVSGFAIRSFDNPFPQARATARKLPNQNFVDDVTWVKGTHTFQWGANVRIDHNDRRNETNSWPRFFINNGFCRALCGTVRNNINAGRFPGIPTVPSSFSNPFRRSIMALYGMVTQFNAAQAADANFGVLNGQPISRHYAAQEYEGYFQDVWHTTRDLTLSLGLRYSYYGVPYERNGQQSQPTVNIHDWFLQRAAAQDVGQPASTIAPLSYVQSGPGVGKPGFYQPDRNNFAPSVAFAYSPRTGSGLLSHVLGAAGDSVLRGGFRVVYDRIGGAMIATNEQLGSIGVLNPLINLSGVLDFSGPACTVPPTNACAAPRILTPGVFPDASKFLPLLKPGFPATWPSDFTAVAFAIDSRIRTPYTYVFNMSYGRQLPGKISLETTYQGRVAHKLLGKVDYGAPLIYLKDTKSGQTLAQAMNQLYNATGQFASATSSVQAVPFFENIYAPLKGTCGSSLPNCTATQAFYAKYATSFGPDFTDAIFAGELDQVNGTPVTTLKAPVFFPQQFSSLPVWANTAWSNYNALQVSARRRFGSLLFDFNYTFSKSIDNASGIESSGQFGGLIQDAFQPANFRGVSDFDIKHQFSANYVVDLPVGHGRMFGSHLPTVLDEIIGGWSHSGIVRYRTGLPLSLGNGFFFPTNFFLTPPGTQICPIKTRFREAGANSNPNLFGNDAERDAAFKCDAPTLMGGSGSRATLRGVGFANVDLSLGKSFKLPKEGHELIFGWQAFNALNHPNFDDRSITSLATDQQVSFGQYTSTIGADERGNNARVMQFSLRYQF